MHQNLNNEWDWINENPNSFYVIDRRSPTSNLTDDEYILIRSYPLNNDNEYYYEVFGENIKPHTSWCCLRDGILTLDKIDGLIAQNHWIETDFSDLPLKKYKDNIVYEF